MGLRSLGAATAVLLLSSCSGGNLGFLWQAGRGAIAGQGEAPPEAPFTVSMDAVRATGLAAIAVTSDTSGVKTALFAVDLRNNLATYTDNDRRSVTLSGNAIYSVRGFGTNLQSTEFAADDPLVTQAKAGDWPQTTRRTLNLRSTFGAEYRQITLECRTAVVPDQTIELFGVTREVDAITEACDGGIVNAYLLDKVTGQMWSGHIWAGPEQGYLDIAVLEPLTL